MLSFWWIFTILVLSTYTANLAAYLTITIVDSPINSLQELAAQDKIRPLLFTGSNLHTLFQVSFTFKVIHLIIVRLSSGHFHLKNTCYIYIYYFNNGLHCM